MDLNIKGVEKELVAKFKQQALSCGQTLKAWILVTLTEAVNGKVYTERNIVQEAPVQERDVQGVRAEESPPRS